MIPFVYEKCCARMKEIILIGQQFCITTDCWTSVNTISYIGVTAHFLDSNFKFYSVLLECSAIDVAHTSGNLSKELQRIVEAWGIKNKILLAVSDNANNIKNAIIFKLNWNHFGCMAHTLNLIVKDGLKNKLIEEILCKVKTIVTHFRKSYTANERLLSYQRNLGKIPLKLLNDVPTRWNSTFYMLERFLELEEAIKSSVALIDKELPIMNVADWQNIKHLCSILKPFENATKIISGELYYTASLVIPMSNGLIDVYKNLIKKYFSQLINEVLRTFLTGLSERLGSVEKNKTLITSTFLDPRFKTFGFSEINSGENAKQCIISAVSEKYAEELRKKNISETDLCPETKSTISTDSDEFSIWSSFDKSVTVAQPRGTSKSRAIIEVQRFLEDEILPRNENPLNWWREHKYHYPTLSIIAQEKLCALASSVPCERLFSKAGQVLNERRTRLSDKKTKMLLFLNMNYQYCNDIDE
ncbi:zinc finger BED domain-containing protein 4-like [Diabrotica undecimpunctata]|uniref:zinc finger BED domain-containing protein 4-like n=1 Tax=Diabrotica undecimpunctata TaxID=50387 RepID=UPI003B63BA3B